VRAIRIRLSAKLVQEVANQSAYAPGAGQTANSSRSKSKGNQGDNSGKEEKSAESKGSKPMFCHFRASAVHFAAECPFN